LNRIPLFRRLRTYSSKHFRSDLIAGLTISVLLIPQGISYAYLAGLPPEYGLYAGLVPLIVYALFASTPYLHIGPVALTSLLIISGISQINGVIIGSPLYIELVLLTGLLVGILQFFLGVFNLGITANFLSRPVISGFTSAAAIIITVSQLKDIMGVKLSQFKFLHQRLEGLYHTIPDIHLITILFGLVSIVIIFILRKINRLIPSALIVLLIASFLTWFFALDIKGLRTIGLVEVGLPAFRIYKFDLATLRSILPTVITLTIFGAVECMTITKALAAKDASARIRANQEFIGIGFSKVLGSFFQAMPTSGSFSRSALLYDMQAKTAVATIISAIAVGLVLLFLSPILYYVPFSVLAAIIICSVMNLFEYGEAKYLWEFHRRDFWNMAITFLVTLVIGIQQGVLIGVILSIMKVLMKSAEPHIAILGQLPGTNVYKNIDRFKDAIVPPKMLIVRFDDELYFANAAFFTEIFKSFIVPNPNGVKSVILDASGMNGIDSVGLRAFDEVLDFYNANNIEFNICRAIGPVRDTLKRTGLMGRLGSHHNFMQIQDAVDDFHKAL